MQDRQPGAPGQYKATLSAAEFQKMQAGERFTITMVRDDQPIVEGTPYSKAAVLPDNLAAIICPDVLNPSPADALRALLPRNGKAPMTANLPMGGHRVTRLGDPVEDDDAVTRKFLNANFALKSRKINGNTLDADITLSASDVGARPSNWMPSASDVGAAPLIDRGVYLGDINIIDNDTHLHQNSIVWLNPDTVNNPHADWGWMETKTTAGSNHIQTITYHGGGVVERRYINGGWGENEWKIPLMIPGVEYRTTERHNGKVIYAKAFSTGALTHGGTFNYTGENVKVVRSSVTCLGHLLPYYGGGNLVGGTWSIWYDITGNQFMGFMGSGMSSNTYTVQVWYTKD